MSKETFDSSEALRRMKEGKKVRRKIWTEGLYVFIKNKALMYQRHITHGIVAHPYSKFKGTRDKSATDWEEVEE